MGKRDRSDSAKKQGKKSKKSKVDDEVRPIKEEPVEETSKKDVPSPKEKSSAKKKIQKKSGNLAKSTFTKKKIDVSISLLPGSLHRCEESVQDSINQMLMKHSDGLGGILMACENVRLHTDERGQGRGWILNELPWIHYTASCDALVFSPHVGCNLQGEVNECFPSHLGILVYSYFNAMVSADQLRTAGYNFDPELHKWVSEGGAQTIAVGSKISFEIEKVHECEGTVSLEGVKPSLSLLVEA